MIYLHCTLEKNNNLCFSPILTLKLVFAPFTHTAYSTIHCNVTNISKQMVKSLNFPTCLYYNSVCRISEYHHFHMHLPSRVIQQCALYTDFIFISYNFELNGGFFALKVVQHVSQKGNSERNSS